MERLRHILDSVIDPIGPAVPRVPTEYQIIHPDSAPLLKDRAIAMAAAAHENDAVIFLDKKARPLAHLFGRVFPALYEDVLPEVRFMNFGSEKKIEIDNVYAYADKDTRSRFTRLRQENPFTSRDELVTVFGTDNIEELEAMIHHPSMGPNRLIVDDLSNSGKTKLLAKHVLSTLDPESTYTTFAFFTQDQRRQRHQYWRMHVDVRDRNIKDDPFMFRRDDRSFRVQRAPSNDLERENNYLLRQDFDLLAHEIYIDRSSS